jgi:hypothetical protein
VCATYLLACGTQVWSLDVVVDEEGEGHVGSYNIPRVVKDD